MNSAKLAVLAMLCGSAMQTAAATPDYAREERWALEVVPQIVVGDAVWLSLPDRPRFLALYTEPSGAAKGSVLIVHGLGMHPDWNLIGALRTQLSERGLATLSVQMPVLAADAPRDSYRDLFGDAGDRLAAAIAWLRAKGHANVAIASHSVGAAMADAFFARTSAPRVDAWVALGMLVDFARPPRIPVLDVVAAHDFPEALASARLRAASLPRDGCSRAITIASTDHYFDRATAPMADAAAAFLERVFSRKC